MHVAVEAIVVTFLVLYYILESFVLFFIPKRWRHKDVKGQTVLITGAGSGIGRLMAQRFAKLGCTLVLWDIDSKSNEQTAAELRELEVTVHTYTCDVSKRQEIYNVANKVKTEVGDVDILVNNAGIVTGKSILECPDEMMQKTMDVNALAHFWTVKAFLPAMMAKNHGHIVTIASGAGLFGVSGLGDYCASKFAAVGFEESLRAELAVQEKTGVHTTVVCPSYVSTGMFEGVKTRFSNLLLLGIMTPEHIVDKIMDAVLTNQYILCAPSPIAYLMVASKGILPVKAAFVLGTFLGLDHSQDEFRGRAKTD